jgi:AcrR family transcriptional regulator
MGRTGRRPGDADTRGEILAAARRRFTEHGYGGATIRAIAADADVDPALVHHYFGAKHELFTAALDIPVNPAAVLPELIAQGADGLGERIVCTMVTHWDAVDANPILMVVRSLAGGGRAADMVREFVTQTVLRPLMSALALPDGDLRATLAASQLVGLLMVRYVAQLPPLDSLPPETLARHVGPTVQRYLTGELPG